MFGPRSAQRRHAGGALNGAPCAIAIAPTGYWCEPVAMCEIGVGLRRLVRELSARSSLARRTGGRNAARGSRHSRPSRFRPARFEARLLPLERRRRHAGEGSKGADRSAGRRRGRTQPTATPAEELALYSASLDLLIVGSRGYGPIGRLIHGSTSQDSSTRTARCPLAGAATLRSADRSRRGERGWSRTGGRSDG